jgi:hypothetical protein
LQFEASLGKYFSRPYLKKTHHKRAGRVAQGEGPEFKPQYHQKKKPKKQKKLEFDKASSVLGEGVFLRMGSFHLISSSLLWFSGFFCVC